MISPACPPLTGRFGAFFGDPNNRDGDRHRRVDSMDTVPELCTERPKLPQDSGEAIVVRAIGSAVPWFLTGWAEGVEVEFMIDTGCQVTILATSVFEKMCVTDPWVLSRLCPCGRRLVLADSWLNIDFPGLSSDMILVVASIGSDGLLGTEACSRVCPTSWI